MNKHSVIALIRGPIVFKKDAINNEATPSIALAYIAGHLQNQGHTSILIDAIGEGLNSIWPLRAYPGYNCQGLKFQEIIDKIPSDVDVIGFSAMFSGEWPVLRDLITLTRASFPNALIIVGGEHATALTEYSLRDCPAIDVCVRGEGEQTFLELLEVYKGEEGSYGEIEGIAYLDKNGEYHQKTNTPKRIKNIDKIAWPLWPEGYLEKFWEAGKSYGISSKRDMPFMISRGCPFKCSFCSNAQMWGKRYYLRELDDIINEIKYYTNTYNITSAQLYDLTAITKKNWTIKFCQRLIDEKIQIDWSFPSGTRSEALNKESLSYLKGIGCKYLVYAPESGSNRTLKKIKKQIKLKDITRSALEAKRQGLIIRTNLIIGFPEESWADVWKTILYGIMMTLKGVDEVPIFIFSPYPGTELFEDLRKKGKIELNDSYFLSLTSLNSSYLNINVVSHNSKLNAKKLGMVRLSAILLNYFLGYLIYPGRIFRTFKKLQTMESASTVFEHRIMDLLKRVFKSKKNNKGFKIDKNNS